MFDLGANTSTSRIPHIEWFQIEKTPLFSMVYLRNDMFARFNPYSSGIDRRRQILTTKVDPRTVKVEKNICNGHRHIS